MKKIYVWIGTMTFLLAASVSCEIDNYEGPNASFSGTIRDAVTKEPVETDLQNGSTIQAYELGWSALTAQTWVIKNTGAFRNDMVFAARYNLEFVNGNFYPFTVENFEIKKGRNEWDFEVTPYLRVRETSIVYDEAAQRVVASFRLEGGKPEVRVRSVRLYAFTDMHVGEQVKFDTRGTTFRQDFEPAAAVDGTTYTLYIDLGENKDLFRYARNYYFRVGALASVPDVGTIRPNYAPLVVIPLNIVQ